MENQTVYPYGTGGSLPSSIGIVNDLKTGGANKALSAEMGKVIGEDLYDTYETIDLSSITEHNYSLAASGWNGVGKHKVIPVTVGEVVKLNVAGSSSDPYAGGFYALFTSAYEVPSSTSSPVPYANGTSRIWLSSMYDNGEVVLTIPENVAYVCICTKDGDGVRTWSAYQRESSRKVVFKEDIVNNLSIGGADKPLSAEQGKVLFSKIPDAIPSGLTKYSYPGNKVEIKKTHYVAHAEVSRIGTKTFQAGACYGDFLFMFTAKNTTCWIYNLVTRQEVQAISIPEAERGFVSNCHCNTVNFGTEKYDENDPFPLIYVSTGYSSGGNTGVLVYRIVATTESDATTYSLSLVQTVKMPGSDWTEFVVGDSADCFIYTPALIYRMRMPKLSSGDITLDYANALDSFVVPNPYTTGSQQGRIYSNGKIYLATGTTNSGRVLVVNVFERRIEAYIYLPTMGLISEPETPFFWRNQLCVAFAQDATIQALYFE